MLQTSRRSFCLFHSVALAVAIAGLGGSVARADETAQAEQSELLTVGSPAPALDVEHWVSLRDGKFKSVTKFAEGRVYVVEFWATWCGPCIASMPHLAELQQRHADDKVQIISISDEPLDTVENFLKRKVKVKPAKQEAEAEQEDQENKNKEKAPAPKTYRELTSAYCLTTDPDNSSHDAYMKAAAERGIPTAFIVGKTGQIEWVGHPMKLDEPLQEVVADQWDRDAFAKLYRIEQQFNVMIGDAMDLVDDDQYDEALQLLAQAAELGDGRFKRSGDLYYQRVRLLKFRNMAENGQADDALAIIDGEMATAAEKDLPGLRKQRFEVFVSAKRDKQAAAELRTLTKELTPRSLNSIAWGIYERAEETGEVSPVLLQAAIDAAQTAVDGDPENPSIVDTLAHLVHVNGDLDRAIQLQTKAVALLKSPHKGIEGYLAELKQEKESKQQETESKQP